MAATVVLNIGEKLVHGEVYSLPDFIDLTREYVDLSYGSENGSDNDSEIDEDQLEEREVERLYDLEDGEKYLCPPSPIYLPIIKRSGETTHDYTVLTFNKDEIYEISPKRFKIE